MRKYETLFIIRPDLEEEQTNGVIDKFKELLEKNGAEDIKVDPWGKRKLAYEVKKFKEGFYVLFQFNSTPEAASELERNFKISDEIIRYLIVRLEEEEK
ncbi:MAG: small subunit ribosomal protein [Clostridia bacterium]|jgi:small subunit ribosomal protein S6|nr:RpsF [Clostridiales bacterium]MDK2986202.1 small subunit ribosomal protein [Clostridia bacterium]